MSTQHPQTSVELSPQNCSDAFVKDVLAIAANFVKEKTQEGWTKADFGKALIDMLNDPIVVEPDVQADTSMDFEAYLKSLVDAAHASVNARADEIIADIRQNHEEVMAMLEEREIELINQYWEFVSANAWQEEHDDKERVITSCLHPHTTFDEWWNNLSDEELAKWSDDYHQYQWGPNGGEEFSGDFEMAVFSFLNSRERQVPLCSYCDSRHYEPGSCMPTFVEHVPEPIVAALPEPTDSGSNMAHSESIRKELLNAKC